MKQLMLVAAMAVSAALAGCGDPVTIQTGEVGKQLTTSGLESEIRQSGAFRLDSCMTTACPQIVRLQTSMTPVSVNIDSLFLPKSNVDVTGIKVGLQIRVRPDQASINRVFAEVPSTGEGGSRSRLISAEAVWKTYGERLVPEAVADAFNDLEIDRAMALGTPLSQYVKQRIDKALAATPIEAVEAVVNDTNVSDAVIQAKRALFAIEDKKSREIKEIEALAVIEDKRQTFQVKRATNDMAIAKQLGIPVAQYHCLKNMERFADAAEEKGTFVALSGDCGLSTSTGAKSYVQLPQASNAVEEAKPAANN